MVEHPSFDSHVVISVVAQENSGLRGDRDEQRSGGALGVEADLRRHLAVTTAERSGVAAHDRHASRGGQGGDRAGYFQIELAETRDQSGRAIEPRLVMDHFSAI